MKKKSSFSFSYQLGYRAGRDRGFAVGKEAGYQLGLKDVQVARQPDTQEHEAGLEQATEQANLLNLEAGAIAVADKEVVAEGVTELAGVNKKTAHILIISAKNLPSYQIGIHQPFSLLKDQGLCTFEVRSKYDVSDKHVADSDIVIVQRSVEPNVYRYFEQARKLGKRTVYVIDDYYEAVPPTGKRGKYFADPGRRKAFADFLKNADIVKVDSSYFEKVLIEKYRSNVVYFPASVDFAWIQQVKKKPKTGSALVIGYEGTDKENDFAPVVPALLRILKEYGKAVRLEFYGFVPEALKNHPSVTYVKPEADYRTFIRRLYQSNWDIGLAPLEENLFNNCKTNNKFREYAACEIPGIYSSSPAYKDWVDHGKTGMIVPHSEEGWYEGMKQLIENRQLRATIREQAELVARRHFTIDACAKEWRKRILHI
ncbi:glycosyltransferase [Paenibacillus sp. J2TS4]|uniref:glycosyltransferase family protein n=1 Tax=Paenibacillus sp. J2TS4 TaxID=2807194 RepID=UPI001B112EC7|nr:glycosyltransferase [Paenibacillus sp. J2TS4]GIP31279.1 hypothetical protein J2TS4_04890 [Paenibacillus sp. J2TS4]